MIDRVAQDVIRQELEKIVEPTFHPSSFGYRRGKSQHGAVEQCAINCWERWYVVDIDIKGLRWLSRFLRQGCNGLWEELHPGRPSEITPAVKHFLLKSLKHSPRHFGFSRPTWTTPLLSEVVNQKFQLDISDECVRQHLQHVQIVCHRPTWPVKHLPERRPGYAPEKAQLPGF